MHHKWHILLQKTLTSCNNWHQNSFMSLKAINESYRALLARALRSTVVAHIRKSMRQMMAMLLVAVLLSGWASNDGIATERVKRDQFFYFYTSWKVLRNLHQKIDRIVTRQIELNCVSDQSIVNDWYTPDDYYPYSGNSKISSQYSEVFTSEVFFSEIFCSYWMH